MSTPTTIQSKLVPLAISTDNGVTYKNVLCKRSSNFNGTRAVNAEESDCGIDKGLGEPDWTIDFDGLVNTTPTSPTEMSAKEIGDLWLAGTQVKIKFQTGSGGSNMYVQGDGYITDFATQLSVGNLMAFTFTFNGVGNPDFSA